MARQSLKQRLRDEAYRRAQEQSAEGAAAEHVLRALDNRGSGPLPYWLRYYARRWGIE